MLLFQYLFFRSRSKWRTNLYLGYEREIERACNSYRRSRSQWPATGRHRRQLDCRYERRREHATQWSRRSPAWRTRIYVKVNLRNQWLLNPALNLTLTRHFTKSLITQIYCNILIIVSNRYGVHVKSCGIKSFRICFFLIFLSILCVYYVIQCVVHLNNWSKTVAVLGFAVEGSGEQRGGHTFSRGSQTENRHNQYTDTAKHRMVYRKCWTRYTGRPNHCHTIQSL